MRTSSAIERAAIFFMTCPRWICTVTWLMLSRYATCLLRRPLDTSKSFLRYAKADVRPGDLTFTSGHPGSTFRLDTVSELEFRRDVTLPRSIFDASELRGLLTQFSRVWRKYSYPATFEPGGTDSISQSLLGLVGLGIPGTANHIATPVSRFLALLGVLQQPGKTQEGMQALVSLLAPDTTVQVSPYCLRPVSGNDDASATESSAE